MIEGLSENRWALLSKVHHCMVDGVSATDLMTVMFDDAPAADARAPLAARAGAQHGASWFCAALRHQVLSPAEQLRSRPSRGTPPPGTSLATACDLLRGLLAGRGLLRPLGKIVADGPRRSAPQLEHGPRSPQRCQGRPRGPRRDGQ